MLLPHNEWSGAAFYTYIRENGKVTLIVKDFFLQDVGSQVYTEYDLNGDVAAYYADHIDYLFGCKVGGLHSHNTMAAFFSGTDMATLYEVGKGMNNLLSIIVNNAGTYSAKFTQKIEVSKHHDIHTDTIETHNWNFLGDESKSEVANYENNSTKDEESYEIRCWDCDIERPVCGPDATLEEEYKKEIEAIRKKTEKTKVTANKHIHTPSILQPSLFGDVEYMDSTVYTDRTDKLFKSIINLSFSDDNCLHNTILGVDNLLFPDAFIASFIDAWSCFYSPAEDEVGNVLDRILIYNPLRGSNVREILIDALDNELNNLASYEQ